MESIMKKADKIVKLSELTGLNYKIAKAHIEAKGYYTFIDLDNEKIYVI